MSSRSWCNTNLRSRTYMSMSEVACTDVRTPLHPRPKPLSSSAVDLGYPPCGEFVAWGHPEGTALPPGLVHRVAACGAGTRALVQVHCSAFLWTRTEPRSS